MKIKKGYQKLIEIAALSVPVYVLVSTVVERASSTRDLMSTALAVIIFTGLTELARHATSARQLKLLCIAWFVAAVADSGNAMSWALLHAIPAWLLLRWVRNDGYVPLSIYILNDIVDWAEDWVGSEKSISACSNASVDGDCGFKVRSNDINQSCFGAMYVGGPTNTMDLQIQMLCGR